MKKITLFLSLLLSLPTWAKDLFPDGTPVSDWFRKTEQTDIQQLGKSYRITDYGVINDSTFVQTKKIQAVIDRAEADGGGVIVIPEGTYLSGALFFKPKTHLHLEEKAVLKGSDDIADFPALPSRMEGQNLKYFAALVNAYGVNGFTLSGKGTINGNGLRYWKSFWLRRSVIPKCTNMDELRPRLLFVWNSNDVQISGVRLINSPFWTTHFYQCNNVKLLDLYIYSPSAPVKAPSTDGVDIDVCSNFLIKNCYISVNDDAVALKGGKGPWADKDPNNGSNTNIIIEDCEYGFCHGVLTCGSESIHNRNVIVRRCKVNNADRLFWLKMRPDTPQNYEYIRLEDIKGNGKSFLYAKRWAQFFDLKDRKDIPISYSSFLTMRNIDFVCKTFFNVEASDQFKLSDFTFENLNIQAEDTSIDKNSVANFSIKKVKINDVVID